MARIFNKSGEQSKEERKENGKVYLESAVYLLIVSLCIAIFFVSGSLLLFFPLAAVASAFFAMSMIRGGQSLGFIYLVAVSVVMYFFTDKFWELFLLISLFLPIGTALFNGIYARRSFNSVMASSFLASALFVAADATIFTFENSQPFSFDAAFSPIFAEIKNIIGLSFDAVDASAYSHYIQVGRNEFISAMFSQLLFFIPVFYAASVLLSILVSNRITRALYARVYGKDEKSIGFFGKLKYFRLSIPGGIFYMIANLIYFFTGKESVFGFVLGIFVSVMTYVFCFEGICVLMSFMSIKEVKKPLMVLACVAAAFFCISPTGIISLVFSLAGLLDCFYNLRKFFNGKGGQTL